MTTGRGPCGIGGDEDEVDSFEAIVLTCAGFGRLCNPIQQIGSQWRRKIANPAGGWIVIPRHFLASGYD